MLPAGVAAFDSSWAHPLFSSCTLVGCCDATAPRSKCFLDALLPQGRSIYAEGTVDAVLFLAKQIESGASQKLYNMVDVLKAGAMR